MQSDVRYHHMWAGDMEKCQSNADMQDISTKQRHDIHVPNTNHSIKKEFIPQELTYSVTSHQPS